MEKVVRVGGARIFGLGCQLSGNDANYACSGNTIFYGLGAKLMRCRVKSSRDKAKPQFWRHQTLEVWKWAETRLEMDRAEHRRKKLKLCRSFVWGLWGCVSQRTTRIFCQGQKCIFYIGSKVSCSLEIWARHRWRWAQPRGITSQLPDCRAKKPRCLIQSRE